ncbi:hypothetical protein T552_00998 [Pneumocystis carinii B80]|uniref:Potassium transport protein n=1 Tax=Pneumocystis carinii (strain B80) TaxID=1408658 RepID=A0A0W4ZN51_PNEC8|nr:hypothetical protein T552_00998 [Pneumocystis carinii B80]KTW29793.1 hypothetical protein T552_00998 [Pneumocystis carinii B80]
MGGTIEKIRRQTVVPKINFLRFHYIYILSAIFIGTFLIYIQRNIKFVDALFLGSSAATQAGLVILDVSTLSTYQQVVLYIVSILTTSIFIHSLTAVVRFFLIRSKFDNIVQQARTQSLRKNQNLSHSFLSYNEIEEKGVGNRTIRVLLRRESANENDFNPTPLRRTSISFGNANPPSKMQEHERKNEVNRSLEESSNLNNTSNYNVLLNKDENTDIKLQKNEENVLYEERQITPDIRFGNLPVPVRKSIDVTKDNELSTCQNPSEQEDEFNNKLRKSKSIEPQPVSTINDTLTPITRLPTYENNYYLRMRKSLTGDKSISKVSTFDRYISNAFRKKRDSSPLSQRTSKSFPYLSYQPTIGRNSAFVTLTKEQRDELGGIEYRALKLLCWILVCYYLIFHSFAAIFFLIFSIYAKSYHKAINDVSSSSVWWAFFTSASLFNDFGMTLNPTSLIEFRQSKFILIFGSFLIIAGNTAFPIFLRFFIWVITFILPRDSLHKESLHFLLDHPRRCFILLFPFKVTMWLFALLVILSITDSILFMVLDFNNPSLADIESTFTKVLNSLFQSFSTRTAGFSIVNLSTLHTAILVSYMFMMYISVFPVAVSIRKTNVYEERSLGIYTIDDDSTQGSSFVGTHIKHQLSFDLWYIFLGLFIICIVENTNIKDESLPNFSVFSILFEIISAYCTVGLSLGHPDIHSSFSTKLSTVSKFVIICLQIRGRHRGLPYALDRAVLLPTEKMGRVEEEDYQRKTKGPMINSEIL